MSPRDLSSLSAPGAEVEVRSGRQVSASSAGPSDADAAVLFCHGAGGSKAQWRSVWSALAANDLRLAAWDFPGHGESADLKNADNYAGAQMVEDWLAMFDARRAPRTVVVAHSYGVRVTLAALARLEAQDRLGEVAGAVLVGPPPPQASLAGGPLATWPMPLLTLTRPWLERSFARLAWSPAADPDLVRVEQRATRRNRLSTMRALMAGAPAVDPAALRRLALPIEVIAGADDRLTPPAGAQALVDALPHASLTVVPACGHQIMLEAPATVVAAIERAFAAARLQS